MNRTKFISAIAAVAAAFCLTSCEEEVSLVSVSVSIDTSEIQSGFPVPESYDIDFTNTNTGEVTAMKDVADTTDIKLLPGIYNVAATARMGIFNYIATATAVTINAESSEVALRVKSSRSSNIVIKEVYYVGVKETVDGKTVSHGKDNFVELYNNGTETAYLDGLAIGQSSNYTIATVKFGNDAGNLVDPDGKDTGLKADDYITVNGSNSVVWQIGGTGTTYPLAPGESAIIASSAVNHTAVVSTSIDLTSAEFETVADKYIEKGQVDNPASVNLVLHNPLNQNLTNYYMLGMVTTGLVVFYLDEDLANKPTVVNVLATTNKFKAISRASVVDAVNWVKNDTTDPFLPADLDAGKITTGTTHTGQSISRKISGTAEDGHNIYQDTNNTTNDFQLNGTPVLRRNGAKVPSWSQK